MKVEVKMEARKRTRGEKTRIKKVMTNQLLTMKKILHSKTKMNLTMMIKRAIFRTAVQLKQPTNLQSFILKLLLVQRRKRRANSSSFNKASKELNPKTLA